MNDLAIFLKELPVFFPASSENIICEFPLLTIRTKTGKVFLLF
jgi:hypothetical protein